MKSNVCDGKNPKFSGMCLTDFGMLCALLGPEFEGALVNASATAGDKMATAATG